MENTLENKEKFFTQYWGQQVITDSNLMNAGVITYVNGVSVSLDFVILKPLSLITEEDFMKIMWKQFPFQPSFKKGKIYHEHLNVNQADYLRSKGYALPYMGLSVMELTEYGWVKLKGAESC